MEKSKSLSSIIGHKNMSFENCVFAQIMATTLLAYALSLELNKTPCSLIALLLNV